MEESEAKEPSLRILGLNSWQDTSDIVPAMHYIIQNPCMNAVAKIIPHIH